MLFVVTHADRVPENFLKHMEGQKGLDKGKIVVLFNGFQKKTQKTPKQEIELAIKLMNEYFDNK